MGLLRVDKFEILHRPRTTTLLPEPAEHYRMTYCVGCSHVRAEHTDDGACSKCFCEHMTVNASPVTAGQWRAMTGELVVMLSRLENECQT